MAVPANLAAIGAVRPGATYPALAHTRDHDRFADVAAYRLGRMPTVRVGQVWADCDPRNAGRTVRVVDLRADGKAVVVNETPATSAPLAQGAASLIAIRRFRPTSRGFSLLVDTPLPRKRRKRAAKAPATSITPSVADTGCGTSPDPLIGRAAEIDAIAAVLASSRKGRPSAPSRVLPMDYRAAAGLAGLLGGPGAQAFLATRDPDGIDPVKAYAGGDLTALFTLATAYVERIGLLAAVQARTTA